MSKSQSPGRVDELGDIFVSVTGEDSVTRSQTESTSDREWPDGATVEIDDGLEDAVAGADVTETADPAE